MPGRTFPAWLGWRTFLPSLMISWLVHCPTCVASIFLRILVFAFFKDPVTSSLILLVSIVQVDRDSSSINQYLYRIEYFQADRRSPSLHHHPSTSSP